MRTQEYSYSLEYREGKSIPVSDTLLRAPLPAKSMGEIVKNVFYTPIKTNRLDAIKTATLADETMSLLKQVIIDGWPNSKRDSPSAIIMYYGTVMNSPSKMASSSVASAS